MPLSISRGEVHDYLGMFFDYSTKGQAHITMYQYIDELLQKVPIRYTQGIGAATPAPTNLYEVRDPDNENVTLLNKTHKDEYHSLTAQLLYLSKRARSDLQTSIAFHCTRVRNPDDDDDKKLARTVRYLNKTKHLPYILSSDATSVIEWWVDATFAVHEDMKSRTGMTMSLGKGAIVAVSTKQKINTTSSKHAELVGASDAMPKILWVKRFMESQDFTVEDVHVYQDN